jgi:hypothetical protein
MHVHVYMCICMYTYKDIWHTLGLYFPNVTTEWNVLV